MVLKVVQRAVSTGTYENLPLNFSYLESLFADKHIIKEAKLKLF